MQTITGNTYPVKDAIKTLGGKWNKTATTLPPEGWPVMTKVDDEHGARNEQLLVRKGHLWFYPDASMYVHYTPTHWK